MFGLWCCGFLLTCTCGTRGGPRAPSGLFSFIMSVHSCPLSFDIRCTGFPADAVNADVAKWIVDYFVAATKHKIDAVQLLSGRIARVTFGEGGGVHKDRFLNEGEVTINGVKCDVIRPPPPPPVYTNVVVFQYPFESDNALLVKELSSFGVVKDIRYQKWTNIPDVSSGTRIVRMVPIRSIPRFLNVSGIRVKIWFKGQPVLCDICRKEGHRAGACPDKGKCLRCHEPGHLARFCPTPWGRHTGSAAAPAAAEVHPHYGNGAPDIHRASDLDKGFEDSDSLALADAASVTEAFLRDEAGSISSVSDVQVEVMGEGVAPPASFPASTDERFNQLDELETQLSQSDPPDSGQGGMSSVSQSILSNCGPGAASSGGQINGGRQSIPPNCGPGAASSGGQISGGDQSISPNCGPGAASLGGESSNCSQINNSSKQSISPNCGPGAASLGGESSICSQISNSSNSNGSVSNLSNNNNDSLNESNSAVNYYGSAVQSDSSSSGPLVDTEMSQASDPRKRPSSEDSRKVRSRVKKLSKKDSPAPYLPAGISSAVKLASTRMARR